MKKRVSPLEVSGKKQTNFSKRVNPLTLEGEKVINIPKSLLEIDNNHSMKRTIGVHFLSKALKDKIKALYPDQKLKIVLENLILKHIYEKDNAFYESFCKSLEREGDSK